MSESWSDAERTLRAVRLQRDRLEDQLEQCRALLTEARNHAAELSDDLAVVAAQRDRLADKLAALIEGPVGR
jgi:chromosome segregation ATPase